MSTTAARLGAVRSRIAAAAARGSRDPGDVTVVAVTKGVSDGRVAAMVAAGVRHLGENRVQAAEARAAVFPDVSAVPIWHLIGHLQRNKVRRAVARFDRVDSVDSRRLAEALDRAAAEAARRLPVLIEVDWTGAAARTGLPAVEVVAAAESISGLAHLDLLGLMTLAPDAGPDAARAVFRQTRALAEAVCRRVPAMNRPVLSMGMSGDFEIAVEEGATEIRIGHALFGVDASPARPQGLGQDHE